MYAYIALSRLFHSLDLDLEQPDLFERAPERIDRSVQRVSKEEILHAIRSNSHMTDKVLEYLVEQGYATIAGDEKGYDVRITVKGIDHLKRYHALYREMYSQELDGHYRYTGTPPWLH